MPFFAPARLSLASLLPADNRADSLTNPGSPEFLAFLDLPAEVAAARLAAAFFLSARSDLRLVRAAFRLEEASSFCTRPSKRPMIFGVRTKTAQILRIDN